MEAESTLDRVSRKGRRVMVVLALILVVIAGGGIWIALEFEPLRAVVYVVVASVLAGALFPRLI